MPAFFQRDTAVAVPTELIDRSYFVFAAWYPALSASCSVMNCPCLVAPYHLPPLWYTPVSVLTQTSPLALAAAICALEPALAGADRGVGTVSFTEEAARSALPVTSDAALLIVPVASLAGAPVAVTSL